MCPDHALTSPNCALARLFLARGADATATRSRFIQPDAHPCHPEPPRRAPACAPTRSGATACQVARPRARGTLDEGDGERGGDGEEQAVEALVARPEAGGGAEGVPKRRRALTRQATTPSSGCYSASRSASARCCTPSSCSLERARDGPACGRGGRPSVPRRGGPCPDEQAAVPQARPGHPITISTFRRVSRRTWFACAHAGKPWPAPWVFAPHRRGVGGGPWAGTSGATRRSRWLAAQSGGPACPLRWKSTSGPALPANVSGPTTSCQPASSYPCRCRHAGGGCISLDFIEFPPARSGHDFVQVRIDLLTGRVWLVPITKTGTAETSSLRCSAT